MTGATTLTHDAMFYGSDQEFVTALVPFVRDGLGLGHAVAAAVTRSNIALLHDALGPDAAAVTFIDRDSWYERPAATVAGWQRTLSAATRRGHRYVRLIGEVGFGPDARHPTWHRYEAALNEVFAQAPAWIVCPYDTRALPATLLADARRTHPTVMAAPDRRRDSDAYLPAEQFLSAVPEPMPPVSGPPALTLDIAGEVSVARRALSALLSGHGWSAQERGDDLLVAVSEIVANSIRHGRGRRELRVWVHGPTVTCEVGDDGPGLADALIGYRPPAGAVAGGRGLWITEHLCDALAIGRYDGRTVVRFAVTVPGDATARATM